MEQAPTRCRKRPAAADGTIAESERAAIEAAIARHERIEDAARELGIGRTTLWRKMRQYNIARLPPVLRKR